MSDCCTTPSAEKRPDKLACPANHHEYKKVSVKTLLHHIKEPWKYYLKDQGYYYCDAEDCDVVYFAEDGQTFGKNDLRDQQNENKKFKEIMLCYCFGVSLQDAKNNPAIKAFVMQHTKQGNCACEARNPSGRCCLKDFP